MGSWGTMERGKRMAEVVCRLCHDVPVGAVCYRGE